MVHMAMDTGHVSFWMNAWRKILRARESVCIVSIMILPSNMNVAASRGTLQSSKIFRHTIWKFQEVTVQFGAMISMNVLLTTQRWTIATKTQYVSILKEHTNAPAKKVGLVMVMAKMAVPVHQQLQRWQPTLLILARRFLVEQVKCAIPVAPRHGVIVNPDISHQVVLEVPAGVSLINGPDKLLQ
jgi:ribosomal protein L30E